MMYVGLAESEVEVPHPTDHHEKGHAARERERDDEGDEHAPGEARRAHGLLFGREWLAAFHEPMLSPRDNSVEFDATPLGRGVTVPSMRAATIESTTRLTPEVM